MKMGWLALASVCGWGSAVCDGDGACVRCWCWCWANVMMIHTKMWISPQNVLSSRWVWIIYHIHARLISSCCHGEDSINLCPIEIQDLLKLHLLFACFPLWFKSFALPFLHPTYLRETTQRTENSFPTTPNRREEMRIELGLPAHIFPIPFYSLYPFSATFSSTLSSPILVPVLREVAWPPWPFMSLSAEPHGRVSLLLLGHGGEGGIETGPFLGGNSN